MNIQTNLSWQIWVAIVSVISFLFSIINFFLGKYIATKILNNDLKHLTDDVKELKEEDKDYKKSLAGNLSKIFRRLGHIEKAITKRESICEERHKK